MRPAVAGQASSRHNGGEVSQALHQGVATETASRAKNTEFLRVTGLFTRGLAQRAYRCFWNVIQRNSVIFRNIVFLKTRRQKQMKHISVASDPRRRHST